MSRSKRLPIIKDRPRNIKKSTLYWRGVRSRINQKVRSLTEENSEYEEIPNPKTIINDYDYCDYIIDYRDKWAGEDYTKKITRK